MLPFLYVLLLLTQTTPQEVPSQEKPQCEMAAHLNRVLAPHRASHDAGVVKPMLKRFNAVDPPSDYEADSMYLIQLPNDRTQLIFVLKDCFVAGMILPTGQVRSWLENIENDT